MHHSRRGGRRRHPGAAPGAGVEDNTSNQLIMNSVSILWRRLDQAGHEAARLTGDDEARRLEGTAVFVEQGQPCRLDYRVSCDAAWRTVSAEVNGWLADTPIQLAIAVDADKRWTLNGKAFPSVQGCIDVDLSFSPSTNLLPIRRLRLEVGQRAEARAAWLLFPAGTLEPLDQVYERVDQSRYRYASGGGAFVAVLETNSAGLVVDYPQLWRAEVPT
ncbi:MAG: putative glycolipid-binding domain-containing protein [Vicinamibacteraceae bacterium]